MFMNRRVFLENNLPDVTLILVNSTVLTVQKHSVHSRTKRKHFKRKHIVLMNGGYMLVPDLINTEFICHVCPIPRRYSNKGNLKKHSRRRHNGRNDQINFGSSVRYLSDKEIFGQAFHKLYCNVCNENFPCK